jgi:hypothetical protein
MIHDYFTNAPVWYVVRTFPSFLHSNESCGPVTFLYLSTWSFTWKVVIFVTRRRDFGGLCEPQWTKLRKYSSLFSTQLYPINVSNLPICYNITLTVMLAMQNDVRNRRRHVVTDCLQLIRVLDVILPFVLLLGHGYCLVKNIKSIRELVKFKNKGMEY